MLDKSLQNNKYVVALGYFDGVHLGHRKVIETAKDLKEKLNAKLLVFSFGGNLKSAISKKQENYIYSIKERERIYRNLGADEVLFAPVDKQFLSLTKQEFLSFLNNQYNICAYVCGSDYTFGAFGQGNAEFLTKFAKENGQLVNICAPVIKGGSKISTSNIKTLLENGEVEKANDLLGSLFFINGKVESGRGYGKNLGFPTANIVLDQQKQQLKDGVYCGKIVLDREYICIINIGACPTFDIDKRSIEVNVLDFNGDLYNKEITVYVTNKIRDIIKFGCESQLINQLKLDSKQARKLLND